MFKNKKGFTVIELVIVIAVIAVLSAILIPVFSNVVSDSQKSKDLQLARDIHVILQAERSSEAKTLTLEEARAALAEEGIKRLKVRYKENAFYWDPVDGYIVLYNYDEDRALYPEEYKGRRGTAGWELIEGDADPIVPLSIIKNIFPNNDSVLLLEGDYNLESAFRGDSFNLSIGFQYNTEGGYSYKDKYMITHVSVIMGNKDITSTVVSNNNGTTLIDIPNITAPVEINYYAVENAKLTSIDNDGTLFGDGKGYKNDYYISGNIAKEDADYDGFFASGLMEIPWEDKEEIDIYVYVKNGTLYKQTYSHYRYYFYDSQKTLIHDDIIGFCYYNGSNYLKITLNKNEHGNFKYFRLSSYGDGENLVVSFNNPILNINQDEMIFSEEPVVLPTVYYDVVLNCEETPNGQLKLNGETRAEEGEVYSATLTAPLGYVVKNVEILMSGQKLNNAYHLEKINISNVTGKIEINVELEPMTFEGEVNINLNNTTGNSRLDGLTTIDKGTAYQATIFAGPGETIDSITIKMGDLVVVSERPNSTSYQLDIICAIDNIDIECSSSGINKVPTALVNVGTSTNSLTDGYADGYRLSTTGPSHSALSGCTATGLIDIPWQSDKETVDIYVYIKDGNVDKTLTSDIRYFFYTGSAYYNFYGTSNSAGIGSDNYEVFSGNYVKFTLNKSTHGIFKSFALSAQGKGEDLIVKFGAPLEEYDVTIIKDGVTTITETVKEGSLYRVSLVPELGLENANMVVKVGDNELENVYDAENYTVTVKNIYDDVVITYNTQEKVYGENEKFAVTTSSPNENTIFSGEYTALPGKKYEANLTAISGCTIDYVIINTCGKTYEYKPCTSTFAITIEKAYGDIEIIYKSSSINKVQTAVNFKTSNINAEGFADGYYLSSGTSHNGKTGYASTGLIEIPWQSDKETVDIYVYIATEGGIVNIYSDGYVRYCFCKGENIYDTFYGQTNTDTTKGYEVIADNYVKFTLNKTSHGSYKSFALSAKGLGKDLIVTFNDPVLNDVTIEGNVEVIGDAGIIAGLPYNVQLTPNLGYEITKVTAIMDDVELDNIYDANTQTISIDKAGANLKIIVETQIMSFEEGAKFTITTSSPNDNTTLTYDSKTLTLGEHQFDAGYIFNGTLTAKNGKIIYVEIYVDDELYMSAYPNSETYDIDLIVCGNIKIIYCSVENQVEKGTVISSDEILNGTGYQNGHYTSINGLGNGTVDALTTATGFIPLPEWNESVDLVIYVYIKDGNLNQGSHGRYYFNKVNTAYKENHLENKFNTATTYCVQTKIKNETYNDYAKITLSYSSYKDYKYIRISVYGTGDNLIVSFNDPIFSSSTIDG